MLFKAIGGNRLLTSSPAWFSNLTKKTVKIYPLKIHAPKKKKKIHAPKKKKKFMLFQQLYIHLLYVLIICILII